MTIAGKSICLIMAHTHRKNGVRWMDDGDFVRGWQLHICCAATIDMVKRELARIGCQPCWHTELVASIVVIYCHSGQHTALIWQSLEFKTVQQNEKSTNARHATNERMKKKEDTNSRFDTGSAIWT